MSGVWKRRVAVVVAAVGVVAGSSCVMPSSGFAGRAGSVAGGPGGESARVGTLMAGEKTQALVMSMADDYIAALGEAVYMVTNKAELSPTGRALAQSFLRNGVGSALDIGSGPNPAVNLLDLLVLASLQTWSFEQHWMGLGIGEAGRPALERLKAAEGALWDCSRAMLSEEQRATLRRLIDAWIAENPERTVVALVRFDEFADERMISSLSLRGQASGLLREVSLAAGAIDDARLLGERVLWYASRYPYLLGEQAELTAFRLADQPESEKVMKAVEEFGTLSATLKGRTETMWRDLEAQQTRFFELFRAERSATIGEFFERFSRERQQTLDDLESREGSFRELMKELSATAVSTGGLAKELTETVGAIDRVVGRFDHDPSDPREPLKLSDVRDVLAETGRAADRMTRVLELTNQMMETSALQQRLGEVQKPMNAVIDRAFWRGVVLILILLGGLAVLKMVPRAKGG